MPGVLSLWLLSLCTSKEKVTRRKGEKVTHSRCSAVDVRYSICFVAVAGAECNTVIELKQAQHDAFLPPLS